MLNTTDFSKIQELNKIAVLTENEIIRKDASLFVNFLEIPRKKVNQLINDLASSAYVKKINFDDKYLIQKIQAYNKLADEVYNMHIFPTAPVFDFVAPFEKKFLYSQNLFQSLRQIIYRKDVGVLQLEKILSEGEREFMGEVNLQPKNYPIAQIFIPNALIVDEVGNFDTVKTIENEIKTAEIRCTLSGLRYVDMQEVLLFNLKNYSNYNFFGIIDEQAAYALAEQTAKEIHRLYSKNVYYYTTQGLNVAGAIKKTKQEFSSIVKEYLVNGDSNSDRFKVGERLYLINHKLISSLDEYDFRTKRDIALEMLRLALNLIENSTNLPTNFYTLKFRNAEEIEKTSEEVTHVMEAHLLGDSDPDTVNDLYVICLTDQSKKILNYIASRGVENRSYVKELLTEKVGLMQTIKNLF